MPSVRLAHVATVGMLAVRVTGTVLTMASARPLRLTTTAVFGRSGGSVTLRLTAISAAATLAGGRTAATTHAIGDVRRVERMVGVDRDLLPDGFFDVA